jgi:hypothetical protein
LAQFILLRRSSEYYPFKRYQVPVVTLYNAGFYLDVFLV